MPSHRDHLLIAEDDEDDFLLTQEALQQAGFVNPIKRVADGEELLEYLYREGRYAGATHPCPRLVLLDLNMPRKDGRDALRNIKGSERLARLPVIALTTSNSEDDIRLAYELGANGYIRKPHSLEQLVHVLKVTMNFWFRTAETPRIILDGTSQ